MQQVLFRVPFVDWPIYGYGMMLFLAFIFCTWLTGRLAKRLYGIPTQKMQDLAIWIFICGILGARITFMIQYRHDVPFTFANFISLWDGGLIFYGSAIGGLIGYFGAYFFSLRKHNVSSWRMADVIAPSAALGLCLGRVGCLLNGCCYGNVACVDCPAIGFPLPTDLRFKLTDLGYQTAAGFTMAEDVDGRVAKVEPNSAAAQAGLKDKDDILEIEIDGEMKKANAFSYIGNRQQWPRGKNDLTLKVMHANGTVEDIGPFVPWTIGLHPTQIYESISMGLLVLLLLAYFPYRPRDGAVMVMFMLCYSVHRFLNELLRNDTEPVAFDMTLSQNISIVVFVCGVGLAVWLWLRGSRPEATATVAGSVA